MMSKTKFGVLIADKYKKEKKRLGNVYIFDPVNTSLSSDVLLTPTSSPEQSLSKVPTKIKRKLVLDKLASTSSQKESNEQSS